MNTSKKFSTSRSSSLLKTKQLKPKKNFNLFNLLLVLQFILLSSCSNELTGGGLSSEGPQSLSGFIFGTVYFMLIGFVAYYFIVVKPVQLEDDNKKKFLSGLKKNEEVKTSGGLIGRVVQVKDEVVTLEIAPKIQVKVVASEVQPMSDPNSVQGNPSGIAKKPLSETNTNK